MRRIQFALTALFAVAALGFLAPLRLEGQRASRFDREILNGREVVTGEVLVKFRSALQGPELARVAGDTGADEVRQVGRAGALHVRSRSLNTASLLARLRNRADVEYAEPNFIIRISAEPNDPSFGQLWGLRNIGQIINFFPGVAGADIDALPAWDLTAGSTAHVVAVLRTWLSERAADASEPLFSTRRGTMLSRDALEHRLAASVVMAGRVCSSLREKTITLHGLRHTCASLLLSAGIPPNVVQQRLGHKRIEITLEVYAHVLPGQQRDAARRLGSLLYGA